MAPTTTTATANAQTIGRRTFWRFCLVGAGGFGVDAGLLAVFHHGVGLDAFTARLVSILVAVTVTWQLNRWFTFAVRVHRSVREWTRYAVVNGAGAALNYLVYSALLLSVPIAPLAALAVASAVALGFNYLGSALLVFARRSDA